jgi:hypothetical protein
MLNLSDKDLDRLSREAAEKYEVEQDPAAWHKLEQLLDKEMGRSSPFPKFSGRGMPFLYTAAAILLISVTYFLLKPAKNTSTSTQKNYSTTLEETANSNKTQQPVPPNAGVVKREPVAGEDAIAKNNAPEIKTGNKEVNTLQNGAPKNASLKTEKNTPDNKQDIKTRNANTGKALNPTAGTNDGNEAVVNKGEGSKNNSLTIKAGVIGNNKNQNEALKRVSEKIQTKEKDQQDIKNEKNELASTNNKTNAGKDFGKNNKEKTPGNSLAEKDVENKNTNNFTRDANHKDNHAIKGAQHTNKTGRSEGEYKKEGGAGKDSDQQAIDNVFAREPKPAIISGVQPLFAYALPVADDPAANALQKRSASIQQDIVSHGKKKNGRALHTNRSLQVGLLYSPDFSQVKYNYNNRIGRNIGLTLGYQLSVAFSINTGLIYTTKNYASSGHDFHLPANCGIDQVSLDFVNGDCYMYEIPLNLRYDFSKEGNTSFFISSGLSSYIMKKENYKFYLHDNIGYAREQRNSYETNQGYWLSVLNLSAGLETKISNSFSIQAEPFLKLPLTGIGFGKVDLSSYGMSLSIKYAPILNRSRH